MGCRKIQGKRAAAAAAAAVNDMNRHRCGEAEKVAGMGYWLAAMMRYLQPRNR
jgi:hypothetical protein